MTNGHTNAVYSEGAKETAVLLANVNMQTQKSTKAQTEVQKDNAKNYYETSMKSADANQNATLEQSNSMITESNMAIASSTMALAGSAGYIGASKVGFSKQNEQLAGLEKLRSGDSIQNQAGTSGNKSFEHVTEDMKDALLSSQGKDIKGEILKPDTKYVLEKDGFREAISTDKSDKNGPVTIRDIRDAIKSDSLKPLRSAKGLSEVEQKIDLRRKDRDMEFCKMLDSQKSSIQNDIATKLQERRTHLGNLQTAGDAANRGANTRINSSYKNVESEFQHEGTLLQSTQSALQNIGSAAQGHITENGQLRDSLFNTLNRSIGDYFTSTRQG